MNTTKTLHALLTIATFAAAGPPTTASAQWVGASIAAPAVVGVPTCCCPAAAYASVPAYAYGTPAYSYAAPADDEYTDSVYAPPAYGYEALPYGTPAYGYARPVYGAPAYGYARPGPVYGARAYGYTRPVYG